MTLGRIRVFNSEYAPTHFDDGRPRLFQLAPDFTDDPPMILPFGAPQKPKPPTRWCVLVHPSRWDAFWMAVNQPDVFAHPEVKELLGLADVNSYGNTFNSDPEKDP